MSIEALPRSEQVARWIDPAENVLPKLREWQRKGLRVTLATLVGIEGSSPQTLGAQMAITEHGDAIGHISSGCLEGALIAEAQMAMRSRTNRLVRYGKGSKYIDIRLPCGSGLDIYFDQDPSSFFIESICRKLEQRKSVALRTNLETGESQLLTIGARLSTARKGDLFVRAYAPKLRLIIAGAGPAVIALARLAEAVDVQVTIVSPDEALVAEARRLGIEADELIAGTPADLNLDGRTASVLLFHDHDWEIPLLQPLLASPCFYLGAVGSRRTQQARQTALHDAGIDPLLISRLRAPIGLLPQAKGPRELAVSILAEFMSEAKKSGLMA